MTLRELIIKLAKISEMDNNIDKEVILEAVDEEEFLGICLGSISSVVDRHYREYTTPYRTNPDFVHILIQKG